MARKFYPNCHPANKQQLKDYRPMVKRLGCAMWIVFMWLCIVMALVGIWLAH